MDLSYFDNDLLLLALMTWREARGESQEARRAVARVAVNRARDARKRWPRSVRQVVLQPYQFSSFNASDPNATKWPALASPVWRDCVAAAGEALGGSDGDPSRGASFYFSPPVADPPPCWGAVELTREIGCLKFWKTA